MYSNELLKCTRRLLSLCFTVTFLECDIASDYHFETVIPIPITHFGVNSTLSFYSMPTDYYISALNSISKTLDIDNITSSSIYVIQLLIELKDILKIKKIKEYLQMLVDYSKMQQY